MDDWEAHLQRSLAAGEVPDSLSSAPQLCRRPSSVAAPAPWTGPATRPSAVRSPSISRAGVVARIRRRRRRVSGWPPGWSGRTSRSRTPTSPPRRPDHGFLRGPGGVRRILVRREAAVAIRTRSARWRRPRASCATAEAIVARVLEHANEWTELCFDELLSSSREAANEAHAVRQRGRPRRRRPRGTCGDGPLSSAAPGTTRCRSGRQRCSTAQSPTSLRPGGGRREVGRAVAARTAPAIAR